MEAISFSNPVAFSTICIGEPAGASFVRSCAFASACCIFSVSAVAVAPLSPFVTGTSNVSMIVSGALIIGCFGTVVCPFCPDWLVPGFLPPEDELPPFPLPPPGLLGSVLPFGFRIKFCAERLKSLFTSWLTRNSAAIVFASPAFALFWKVWLRIVIFVLPGSFV